MILNLGSLAFNANIAAEGGTPAWGTELGQGEGYKFMFEDMSDFFTGMVYSSVADIENVTCPLGKGGNARNDFEFVIASHFKKIYVNNQNVPNAQFILLVIKKLVGDHHVGRRSIKYNPRMTYRGEEINDDCYQKIANSLGLNNNSAWFVHEINILNQDELHFTAYKLGEQAITYSSTEERKNAFLSKLPKDGKKICVGESILQNKPLQQIYYGAPGTGKSHTINNMTEAQPKENVFRTTFHPDSDYSTFVGAYKPTKEKSWHQNKRNISIEDLAKILNDYYTNTEIGKVDGIRKFCYDYCPYINGEYMKVNTKELAKLADISENYSCEIDKYISFCKFIPKQNSGKITYEFVPQSFTKAYVRAWQTDEPVYLVIEEINRGNCAQIFGDLFQLLDRKDGFSEYPIKADNDLAQYLSEQFFNNSREDIPENVKSGEELVLPNNLYIWATMNTSDQSLFPIDSAFKRRWDWKYVPISNTGKDWRIEVNNKQYDWWDFLNKVNEKIGSATNSEDKKLGYFFCKATNGIINAETFVGKVIFYIWNDVFKDFADEAGSLFKDIDNSTLSFNKFYTVDGIGNAVINEAKVALFLQNLGVNASNEEENDDEEDETSNETNSKHKHLRSVVFSDGTIFSKEKENIKTQFDIYLESLKKIGLDTVCPLIAEMKYQRKGCPMVSTEKQPDILESNTYEYHQEGKYYIVKGAHDDTLINILEELKAQLNLDIEINFE